MEFEQLKSQYFGPEATRYEARRKNRKWRAEQAAVESFLRAIPAGSTVLDIPVGTGRFIPLYQERGLKAIGLDISADMLSEARKKIRSELEPVTLKIADARKIEMPDSSVDCIVCTRFLNWIETGDAAQVIGELCRVSKSKLLIGVRNYVPIKTLLAKPNIRNLGRAINQVIKRRFDKSGLIVHKLSDVRSIFERLELKTISATCIENRKDGTDYFIYFLEK